MRMRRFVLMVLTGAFTIAAVTLTTVFVGSSIYMMNEITRLTVRSPTLPDAASALADIGIAIALLIASFSVFILCLRRIPIRLTPQVWDEMTRHRKHADSEKEPTS